MLLVGVEYRLKQQINCCHCHPKTTSSAETPSLPRSSEGTVSQTSRLQAGRQVCYHAVVPCECLIPTSHPAAASLRQLCAAVGRSRRVLAFGPCHPPSSAVRPRSLQGEEMLPMHLNRHHKLSKAHLSSFGLCFCFCVLLSSPEDVRLCSSLTTTLLHTLSLSSLHLLFLPLSHAPQREEQPTPTRSSVGSRSLPPPARPRIWYLVSDMMRRLNRVSDCHWL